ncbi:hypothetical protein LSTR_LSTR011098 [Laodelphax striatellus]|uniref:RRM domain-containing protein n=1 Tax=Laodelphax striatellus TaxID=195883 RepID=A0A482XIC4_LAOST|nr:hypothetical protein LSTR_LSTR011098 [Laodelphax striatellus]
MAIVRDPSTGNSRGFCFLHYGSFEASDAAIAAMNQQHLCNRAVCVSYAYRRDAAATDDRNRRHGSAAERLLAATNPLVKNCRPNQLFADAPPLPVVAPPPPPPPPTLLADSVAPPLVAAASGATGGFSFPGCPPPLIAVSQESAAVVAVPALPCALLPPPPPPPPPRSDVIKMEGADPPPLSHLPPPPTNLALQNVLQSSSLRLLTSYSPMKSMLPPPPPPPPLHYSPMTSSMPPPPPPPPLQPSSSWNSYHFQPTMQEHINRFGGQMTPQHLMSARPQCPMTAPQHPMNMCPIPAERRTSFMQGDRPLPSYWNEYQDSHRR